MAVRTWTAPLGVAIGAGVLAGAGQLGIGEGLGILRWNQHSLGATAWHTQLTWVAFIAASAVIVAALAGDWRASRLRQRPELGQRIATVVAGTIGAAVVLPLAARPAGGIGLAETGSPRLIVGITAAAGLLFGLIGAFAVLAFPSVRGNVISCTAWVWLASMVSAVWALGNGSTWASARLAQLPPGGVWTPVVMIGVPVLVALVVSAVARFGGGDPITISVSGGTGPLLVAGAYLAAGPGGQSSAYWSALIAVAAGLAISVPVAFVRRPAAASSGTALPDTASPGTASPGTASPGTAPVPAAPRTGSTLPAGEGGGDPADAGETQSDGSPASETAGEVPTKTTPTKTTRTKATRTRKTPAGGAPAGETGTGQDRPEAGAAATGPAGDPSPPPEKRAGLLKAARAFGRGRRHGTADQPGPTGPTAPTPVPEASPAPDLWSTPGNGSDAAHVAETQQTAVYRQVADGQPPAVTQYSAPVEPVSPPEPAAGSRGGKSGWRIPRARKASSAEAVAPLQAFDASDTTLDAGNDTDAPEDRPRGKRWGLKRSGRRTDEAPGDGAPADGEPSTPATGRSRDAAAAAGSTAPAAPSIPAARSVPAAPPQAAPAGVAVGTAAGSVPDPAGASSAKGRTRAGGGRTAAGGGRAGGTKAAGEQTTATGGRAVPRAGDTRAAAERTTAGAGSEAARAGDAGAGHRSAGDTNAAASVSAMDAPATNADATNAAATNADAAPGKPAKKRGRAGKSAPSGEPASGRSGAGSATGPSPAATEPAGTGPSADAQPVKQRRWASRRKADAAAPATAPEDDEYVDWVKGLGAAEPTVRIAGNRAARHSRDAGDSSDSST